ncbi:hypothetical protein [Hydrogenivirga sp. 128-5-R1-1]|uniref:hypothetical protein n=1 Tax=Hydrogenivirga sp. 128-5-R1-1 TaxID=392423 RepID=UPI0003184ECA|nr:hypothetical protein [Hydrogenivirga sp. 128-5-R1-1]
MRLKSLGLLALALVIGGCSSSDSGGMFSLSVGVNFPSQGGLRTQYIDPRTACIELTLSSRDGTFKSTAILTPSSPYATFSGLTSSELIVTIKSTDGSPGQGTCTGNVVDYASASLSLKPGTNSLSLTMPRAKWTFTSPINLSGGESITGISLTPLQTPSVGSGYGSYRISFFGDNLYDCGSGYGTICYATVDYHVKFEGPDKTQGSLGSEFVPYPSSTRGWIGLAPSGGVERYALLVGSVPCTYKREANLKSCVFSISQDLSQYIGVKTSGSSITGYLWEVFVKSKSLQLECAWDENFTDPLSTGCPDGVSIASLSVRSQAKGDTTLKTQASIQNLSASLIKVHEYNSKDYASCDQSQPDRCDYNLDGVIDSQDDTNGDGQIDTKDSKTFYSRSTWSMNFDLNTFSLSASAGQETDPVQPHLFISSQNPQTGPLVGRVTPVSSQAAVKTSSPAGMDILSSSFLVWGYGTYDTTLQTFSGFLPRWYIVHDSISGNLIKLDAFNPDFTSGKVLANAGSVVCYIKEFTDPYISTSYVFIVGGGADTVCNTGDDTTLFLDTNRGLVSTNVPYLSSSSSSDVMTFSDSPNRAVTGFIGVDVSANQLTKCDLDMNCTLLGISANFLTPIGFSRADGLSYGVVDDGTNKYLGYYDVKNDQFTLINTAVDGCVLDPYTVYCYTIDTISRLINVYKLDPATKNFVSLTVPPVTVTTVNAFGTTANYVILSYYDVSNGVVYVSKDGSSSGTVDFGTAQPILNVFSGDGAFGSDTDFCYVLDSDIANGRCIQSSKFVRSTLPYTTTFPTKGTLDAVQTRFTDKVYVVEGCTPINSGVNCVGGTLYRYGTSMDPATKEQVMNIPSTLEASSIYGSDEFFLVSLYDPNTSQSSVTMVSYTNSRSPGVLDLGSGYITGIVANFTP